MDGIVISSNNHNGDNMKLIINDWSGGLVPHWWENTNLKKIGADNQFASGVVNPLIYPGFLSFSSLIRSQINLTLLLAKLLDLYN